MTVTSIKPETERSSSKKRLGLLLIKPSHYDDDGYVIQWWRSFVVNNALAVMGSVISDAADRQAVGPDIDIERRLIDEVTEVVRPDRLIDWLAEFDYAAVLLVAVQTSQFPRALDITRPFAAAGYPVIIGGVHVSGALAMVPNWEPAFAGASEAGASLFAGEFEPHVDELLNDIVAGSVKPFYDRLASPADLGVSPRQRAEHGLAAQTVERHYGLETGRGCPFVCSFCTIINFHGRKMRHRHAEAIEAYLRDCHAHGGRHILVTDDNFARSPVWREVTATLERLQRELNVEWDVAIQVDALAYRIDGFVDACKAAGVKRVFIGIESVRPDNLKAAAKGQNKLHLMHDMAMTWRRAGVLIYGAMIVGLANDTPERVAEDVRILQEEIPVDILSAFLLTPHPGSADHKHAVAAGVVMDDDLNRYDTVHPVVDHPIMSRDEWEALYWDTWKRFYTKSYMKTVIARALRYGVKLDIIRSTFVCAYTASCYERVHPLDSGGLRFRDRMSRRPNLPRPAAIPHAIRQFATNTVMLTRIASLLLYAYGLELYLRVERARGRLDLHTRIRTTPEVEETPTLAQAPVAAAE
ncbi:radical SAM protein [Thalassobaculum sp. OXR-137]|uniref:B12-binding domain-containing radical SAM protein n=1 Tax=Thalassobaculum sp. OXR-137 TaxID=3100173 RepID=UPI002AC9D616|nr:radical SAM protein [Thalassobaculum sp. OXR-137]WPZ35786.1 radical SAM protein [Thalassobaculum sp. OXR-137]